MFHSFGIDTDAGLIGSRVESTPGPGILQRKQVRRAHGFKQLGQDRLPAVTPPTSTLPATRLGSCQSLQRKDPDRRSLFPPMAPASPSPWGLEGLTRPIPKRATRAPMSHPDRRLQAPVSNRPEPEPAPSTEAAGPSPEPGTLTVRSASEGNLAAMDQPGDRDMPDLAGLDQPRRSLQGEVHRPGGRASFSRGGSSVAQ